jgi:hypothetical protein
MKYNMTFVSKHGLFLSQFFFSAVGVGFSIAMLIKGNDPSIYLPILSTIIGVWTPNPLSQQKVLAPAVSGNVPSGNREVRLESVVIHDD